jgi:hypothetical protein
MMAVGAVAELGQREQSRKGKPAVTRRGSRRRTSEGREKRKRREREEKEKRKRREGQENVQGKRKEPKRWRRKIKILVPIILN